MTDPQQRLSKTANALLALTTGLAFAVLVLAASAYAPPAMRWRPVAVGPAVVLAYLLLNSLLMKQQPRPPLIQFDSPITLVLAGVLPLILLGCAGAATIWRGHDFTLATIVAGVLFGVTLQSAWTAAKGGG